MRIEVRLFANFREVAGTGELEVEVEGDTVGDVLDAVFLRCPELEEGVVDDEGGFRDSVRLLVDGEVSSPETEVEEGEEVALLPPVSGGLDLEFKLWLANEEGEYVIGEGGAEILEAVEEESSVAAAADSLGMSNRFALERIRKMEERLGDDLVERSRGGEGGGGSELTGRGRELLERFEKVREEFRRVGMEMEEEV